LSQAAAASSSAEEEINEVEFNFFKAISSLKIKHK